MALSMEEKDALNDHFRDKDLYDPSKDPKQEVSTFEPKGLCGGGEAGYADGGQVIGYSDGTGPEGVLPAGFDGPDLSGGTDDFSGPAMSGDTTTVKGTPPPPVLAGLINEFAKPPADPVPAAAPALPQAPAIAPRTAPSVPQDAISTPNLPMDQERAAFGAPADVPAPTGKLPPDQMAELYKALTAKPSIGQSAFSGLAGLADAIETGVARTGNPGFQKNITEQQQLQKQNLVAALEAKYKGQGLSLEKQKASDENTRAANALAGENARSKAGQDISKTEAQARIDEAKNQAQINALEGIGRLSQNSGLFGYKNTPDTANAINALTHKAGIGGASQQSAQGPVHVTSAAQYAALPKGTPYTDASGKNKVKQ